MLAPACAVLLDQKKRTVMVELNGPVFVNPTTRERDSGSQQTWKVRQTALKHANVRYRLPYQTGQNYASVMLSAGENPMRVAQQTGRVGWATIARVYGHWMPSADPAAGSKAFNMCGGVPAENEHTDTN